MKREETLYEVLQLSENAEEEVVDAAFTQSPAATTPSAGGALTAALEQ